MECGAGPLTHLIIEDCQDTGGAGIYTVNPMERVHETPEGPACPR